MFGHRFPRDGELRFAFDNWYQSVERSRAFGETLAFVESEDGDRAGGASQEAVTNVTGAEAWFHERSTAGVVVTDYLAVPSEKEGRGEENCNCENPSSWCEWPYGIPGHRSSPRPIS